RTIFPFDLALLSLATALAAGCTTTLQHGRFNGTPPATKGSIGVSARAENMRSRIGWGTFTVFALPIAPVTVRGEPDKELVNQIRDALEHCGYDVKLVENQSAAPGLPLLTCNVREFAFKNYTYFFPIVFNWGTIQMEFVVRD